MGLQKSIMAARSIFLRRRLQPALQQPPDLSGAAPHPAAARALLLPLGNLLPRGDVWISPADPQTGTGFLWPNPEKLHGIPLLPPKSVWEKPRRDSGRFTSNSANLSRKSREAEMSSWCVYPLISSLVINNMTLEVRRQLILIFI